MLRIKQVLQSPIILLLLGGIVLGSIPFSLTACEGINLINRVIIAPRQEGEAMNNIGAIMRAQLAYRLEWQTFSDSIKELGIGYVPNSENYSYRIYTGIQTTLNDYLFLNLDKATIKSLKIPEDEAFTPPKKLPRISSDILMISAQPNKAGLRTYIGFIFTCSDPTTGGSDCAHESVTFSMLYESEQPLTPPPNRLRLKVSLPFAPCQWRGCLREKVPTPEGFRPVEDSN